MKHKKGSLNISIEAIVIVVIAMTVLGLGLAFVQSQFDLFGGTSTQVQQQIKEQVLDTLRKGGDKADFSKEISFKKGERKVLSFGVQNVGNSQLYFKIKPEWDFENSDPMGMSVDDWETAKTDPPSYQEEVNKFFELRWEKQCLTLSPNDAEVYGINGKAPKVSGTYALRVTVEEYADADCSTLQDDSIYSSKLGYVTVG